MVSSLLTFFACRVEIQALGEVVHCRARPAETVAGAAIISVKQTKPEARRWGGSVDKRGPELDVRVVAFAFSDSTT